MNKAKNYLAVIFLSFFFGSSACFPQSENYRVTVQFSVDGLTFKLYERPDGNSKIIAEIKNNDTIVVVDRQNEWFKVITSSTIVGWFAYQAFGSYHDSKKNSWITWNVEFKDISSNAPIDLTSLSFNSSRPNEKIEELEQRLSDLENRVEKLEKQITNLSTRSVPSSVSSNTTPTGPQPPSDDQIKQAIRDFFARKVPPTWAGSLMGGKDAQISSIEIYQTGNYNDRMRYWPVRARVVGTCQANLLARYETTSFDNVGDFKIYQDDYGNWKAAMDSF